MRILIIGGTNFIGPNLIKQINKTGRHNITLFHRNPNKHKLPSNVRQIFGAKMQLPQFKEEFRKLSPDVVVDMIAYTEDDAVAVINTFQGIVDRVVTISSQDVYRAYGILIRTENGSLEPVPITETSALRSNRFPYHDPSKDPNDWCNKYDKILVEDISMNNRYIKGTILRLPAIYGPLGSQHRLSKDLFLRQIGDKRPFILMNEVFSRWCWTRSYVENVARAIALAIVNERSVGRIYNVGEPKTLSVLDFVTEIARISEWNGEVVLIPADRIPPEMTVADNLEQQLVVSSDFIRQELGFAEIISFRDGLRASIKWELANKPKETPDYAKEDEILHKLDQQYKIVKI